MSVINGYIPLGKWYSDLNYQDLFCFTAKRFLTMFFLFTLAAVPVHQPSWSQLTTQVPPKVTKVSLKVTQVDLSRQKLPLKVFKQTKEKLSEIKTTLTRKTKLCNKRSMISTVKLAQLLVGEIKGKYQTGLWNIFSDVSRIHQNCRPNRKARGHNDAVWKQSSLRTSWRSRGAHCNENWN